MDSIKIKRITLGDGFVIFDLAGLDVSKIEIEITLIDNINIYDPRTWMQIRGKKVLLPLIGENSNVYLDLKELTFSNIIYLNEIRVILDGKVYNIECEELEDNNIISLSSSRGTVAFLQRCICAKGFSKVSRLMQTTVQNKYELSLETNDVIDSDYVEWYPKFLIVIERYVLDSNVGRLVKQIPIEYCEDKSNMYRTFIFIPDIYNDDFASTRKTYVFWVDYYHKKYNYISRCPLFVNNIDLMKDYKAGGGIHIFFIKP